MVSLKSHQLQKSRFPLEPVEEAALRLIFLRGNAFNEELLARISSAQVIERDLTGVGFYSTIEFKTPLKNIPDYWRWDRIFSHPQFHFGGTFSCQFISSSMLELEAVALGGVNWPENIDLNKFSEMP